LHIHPDDAQRTGVADGSSVRVRSKSGEIVVPAEVTDAVRPGVVSIPHGWGHDRPGMRTAVATKNAGANLNVLAHADGYDPLSGNAVLTGIAVELTPA
jgi:anaerobic selenocysteine-containing dehydrogenase